MNKEGPPLETIIRRIAETPAEFLLAPRIGTAGDVHVPAVVNDTLKRLGIAIPVPELAIFAGRDPKTDRVRLSITLLACWTIADESLRAASPAKAASKPATAALADVMVLLRDDASELAAHTTATKIVQDADRREELARLALARLGLRPAGETLAQAQDRLTTLSSAERARLLKASRQAEERASAIRAALARKAAEESADKWTRE
jgi:hypothetical protein